MVDSPRISTEEWLAKHGGESAFTRSDLGVAGESRQSPEIGWKRLRAGYRRRKRATEQRNT